MAICADLEFCVDFGAFLTNISKQNSVSQTNVFLDIIKYYANAALRIHTSFYVHLFAIRPSYGASSFLILVSSHSFPLSFSNIDID